MKILFSPFSPYVRKCLVTAHELGLDHKIQLLPSNAHPVNRDRQIIETNPLGKVPTLYTDDGQTLYDSRVICEYLNSLADGPLFPASGRQRWSTLTQQSLGDGILDAALLARYEDVARPEEFRFTDWKLAQMDKFETSLKALNNEPSQLAGRVDIGTLTVGCALWYLDLRFSEIAWRDRYPKVASWYQTFGQRPSMSAVWSLT
jgi:glutathione S-transferase